MPKTTIRLNETNAAALDDYRQNQAAKPSRDRAGNMLVEEGLKNLWPKKRKKNKTI